jgi:hypothetical protein
VVVREKSDVASNSIRTTSFQLLKVTDIVVEPGQTVTAQLPVKNGAQVFRFLSDGRETFIRPIRDKEFVSPTNIAGLSEYLRENAGISSDGYVGIDAAIGELDYRDGSARQITLVTDSDRESANEVLDFDSLSTELADLNARLNAILDAEFETASGDTAIGMRANQNVFSAGGASGYEETSNGDVVDLTGRQTYGDLAWASDGVVWDLNQLRSGGSTETAFDAFTEVTSDALADDFSIDVVASNSDIRIQNLSGPVAALVPGQNLEFDLEFSQRPENGGTMDLFFERTGTGTLVGSLPVRLVDTFVYDSFAVDPDGDTVRYTLLDSPDGANIDLDTGRVIWKPSIVGVFDFKILADDGKGGEAIQEFAVNVVEG